MERLSKKCNNSAINNKPSAIVHNLLIKSAINNLTTLLQKIYLIERFFDFLRVAVIYKKDY